MYVKRLCAVGLLAALLSVPRVLSAQDCTPGTAVHELEPVEGGSSAQAGSQALVDDRVLGFLPNYGTVEPNASVSPASPRWMFEATAKNTFDPVVFAFTTVTAGIGQGHTTPYPARYATSFADNAIGNFMTSDVFPSVLGQDPRYYERGRGGYFRRAAYAASRIAVTRSSSGRPEFNYSEVAGNLTASVIANVYHPQPDRSLTDTVTRWGTQILWDALSNELKEFWPDIRRRLHSTRN